MTYVAEKGARYCLQQLGDPPEIEIDGRKCVVRAVQEKDNRGEGHYLMPARGSSAYLGKSKDNRRSNAVGSTEAASSTSHTCSNSLPALGVASIAAAYKLGVGEEDNADEAAAEAPKRKRKKKEEIVTITRRQVPLSPINCACAGHQLPLVPNVGPYSVARLSDELKKTLTTLSVYQDAEPLNKRPITMKEIFPKEFWRV